MPMSSRDTELLMLEGSWWHEPGTKADVVAQRAGLTLMEFDAEIERIIDEPSALDIDPMLVRRLRRARDRRREERSGQRMTGGGRS